MEMNDASLLYAQLLLEIQTEIEGMPLVPDKPCVTRGDLIAELLSIASRIRSIQARMRRRPLQPPDPLTTTHGS